MKIGGLSQVGGPSMVDALMDAERVPIKAAEQRRGRVATTRDQFKSFDNILSGLGTSLESLKSPSNFAKMALESSHPDLLDGTLAAGAKAGVFEFEVANLAKAEKQLAFGFADKDKTEVGFGHMRVGAGDLVKDITIEPGSTLSDVAQRINDSESGVRAMIVNTEMKEDPFRLLVSSLDSGEETVMELDPDTTFTEFKQLTAPRDLNVKFEGVDVRRETNKLDDLIEGVSLRAKASEPGTRIQVEIKPDLEKTSDGVKDFVKNYNEVIGFAKTQSQIDPQTGKAGLLSGDSALRGAVRKLQANVSTKSAGGLTLMDAGITTDPHSGQLRIDEAKLKDVMSKDFDGVAAIFANSESGPGLAQKLSDSLQHLRDRQSGAVTTRLKGMEQTIKNQDRQIQRQEERMTSKRAQLERTFASLDAKMATMQGTSQFLGARFQTPQAQDNTDTSAKNTAPAAA